MPFVAFHELCPEVANREMRTITVLPAAKLGVPTGDYHFIEMYCDEAGCDCRRVFFMVLSPKQEQVQAVIAWGWEDRAFYKKWLGMDDPRMVSELQGPVLNLASPQSENAEALLELTRKLLLQDPDYVARIKRHYAFFARKSTTGLRKSAGRLCEVLPRITPERAGANSARGI